MMASSNSTVMKLKCNPTQLPESVSSKIIYLFYLIILNGLKEIHQPYQQESDFLPCWRKGYLTRTSKPRERHIDRPII